MQLRVSIGQSRTPARRTRAHMAWSAAEGHTVKVRLLHMRWPGPTLAELDLKTLASNRLNDAKNIPVMVSPAVARRLGCLPVLFTASDPSIGPAISQPQTPHHGTGLPPLLWESCSRSEGSSAPAGEYAGSRWPNGGTLCLGRCTPRACGSGSCANERGACCSTGGR